jgi:hypothetical protein
MRQATRVGDAMRNMGQEVEAETTRLIAYFNDEVVPELRKSISHGLRGAAERLATAAEQMDRVGRTRPVADPESNAGPVRSRV